MRAEVLPQQQGFGMNPALKRFHKQFGAMADTIATADVHQVERERMAEELANDLNGKPDFKRDLFVLLASDPLVPCAGIGDEPCPHGRKIRIPMHLSSAPDGRSKAWSARRPTVRCISCGSAHFRENR